VISLNEALIKARNEMHQAIYLSETASNAGLRKIYENKADYLSQLIYAASTYKKLLEGNKYG
jgi:TRAP-type mannitol/chloroaromatic compound transport system substrate-binding protein